MTCPRCGAQLESHTLRQAGLTAESRRCPACDGHWFPAGELAKLDDIVEVRIVEFRGIPRADVQKLVVYCPACPGKIPMSKSRSRRDRKVTLDACPQCSGIWLDAGELAAIQEEGLFSSLVSFFRALKEG